MAEYVYGKKSSVTSLADKIRAKTGATNLLSFKDMENAIDEIGTKLNIHYSSTTAPTDTSQLWVKADINPSKVSVGSEELPLKNNDNENNDNVALSTLKTKLTNAVEGIASAAIGTKIYLFGGYDGSTYYNKIQVFDSESETITTLSTKLPAGAYEIGLEVVENKIYLFGGYHSSVSTAPIRIFDSESTTITTLSATVRSRRIHNIPIGRVENKIYLFGGMFDSSVITTIQVFDIESETITTLDTTLSIDYYKTGAMIGNKFYLLSGGDTIGKSRKLQIFYTETNTLSEEVVISNFTNGRMGTALVGTKIYLFGGIVTTSAGIETRIDVIQVFDSESETITTLEITLPNPTRSLSSTAIGKKIYLFGGRIEGGSRIDTIQRFEIDKKVYILEKNNLYLKYNDTQPQVNIINTKNLNIKVGVSEIQLGNENNTAEEIKGAIHNGTEWQEI